MFKKIALAVLVVVALFLIYVSTRNGRFHYEASGVINAPAEKIFPFLANFHNGAAWSPYEKADPDMKKIYSEQDGTVGATMQFESKNSGSGILKITGIDPNKSVDMTLTMTKPFHAENLVHYELTPEGNGTRFTWSMSGDGGFMGKLIATLIDCKAMVIHQFDDGIQNLKTLMEAGLPH